MGSQRFLVSVLIIILTSAEISCNSSDLQGGSSAQIYGAAHQPLQGLPAPLPPCPPAVENTPCSVCVLN